MIIQALQGFAQACENPISKGSSFLCFAPCCTVLRSRWCQSGVRSSWITRRRFHGAQQASRNGDGLPATVRVHARLLPSPALPWKCVSYQRGAEGSRTSELRRAKVSASHCRKPRLATACCVHTPSVPSGLGMWRTVRSLRAFHSSSCRSICEASRVAKTPSGETARGFPRYRTWMHMSISKKRAVGVKR